MAEKKTFSFGQSGGGFGGGFGRGQPGGAAFSFAKKSDGKETGQNAPSNAGTSSGISNFRRQGSSNPVSGKPPAEDDEDAGNRFYGSGGNDIVPASQMISPSVSSRGGSTQGGFSATKTLSFGAANSEKQTGFNPPAATTGGGKSFSLGGTKPSTGTEGGKGFSLGGTKPSTGSEGGKAFSFGGSSTKPDGKPGFQAPSAGGGGFGSNSFGKKTDDKEASSSQADTAPSTSSNSSSSTTTTATQGSNSSISSTSTSSSSSSSSAPSSSHGKGILQKKIPDVSSENVQQVITKFSQLMKDQLGDFLVQAKDIREWELAVIRSEKYVDEMSEKMFGEQGVRIRFEELENSLKDINDNMGELDQVIEDLEGRATSLEVLSQPYLTKADRERQRMLQKLVESNEQLDYMSQDVENILMRVNEGFMQNESRNPNDPFIRIQRILNDHIRFMKWVETNSDLLSSRIRSIENELKRNRASNSTPSITSGNRPMSMRHSHGR